MVASISMAQFSLADTNVLVAMKLICQYVPILKSVASRFQRMPMDQWQSRGLVLHRDNPCFLTAQSYAVASMCLNCTVLRNSIKVT
jgi:hypothetical protein